jgi:tungstate transport system substrate-binding protein
MVRLIAAAFAALVLLSSAQAQTFITVASTTSTENTGLFGDILPRFKAATGIEVRVVAVGTGQAVRLAERGDADVLFVHHKPSEEAFIAAGHGVKRYPVMYNDFVVIGPSADPAKIRGLKDAMESFRRVAAAKAVFASRGDDSGTHKAELALWKAAGIDPKTGGGTWYRELGAGMGATLNTAGGLGAYVLADRGSWSTFKNRQSLELLVEGDRRLFNQYGVMLVNPAKHPHVKAREGQAFVDWLISPAGQQAIAAFRPTGEPLFFPNAGDPGA